jgi:hypothetical protein
MFGDDYILKYSKRLKNKQNLLKGAKVIPLKLDFP